MSNQPKPLEIRQLEGNRGKRPMPKPVDFKDASSRIPEELTGYAKEWYKIVCAELRSVKILKIVDVPKLAIIAQVYKTMREAQEGMDAGLIIQTDDGKILTNPCEAIFRLNAKLYHDMASSFGLSPVDRARLAVAVGKNMDTDKTETTLKDLIG